jgi:hypothetical protein
MEELLATPREIMCETHASERDDFQRSVEIIATWGRNDPKDG